MRNSCCSRAAAVPTAVFLLFTASYAYAQTAPAVSNVRAAQRADGSRLVDIHYDLSHGAACTVWPVLSGDAGVSWSVPGMRLTGDLGPAVTPGTNNHSIWELLRPCVRVRIPPRS
jgi:hypothetical protein